VTSRGFRWLIGLTLLGAGFGAGVLLARPSAVPPSLLVDERVERTVALTKQPVDDVRDVQLSIQQGPNRQLFAAGEGLLTDFDCAVGTFFRSGASNLSIDGRPVLNLATETPMWRDLRAGDTGDDVRALTRELKRLGHPVAVENTLRSEVVRLLRAGLMREGSRGSDSQTIRRERLLWLPERKVEVLECLAEAGTRVTSEQAIAGLSAKALGASVVNVPADAVPGERVIELGGDRIAVDSEGRITSKSELVKLDGAVQRALSAREGSAADGGAEPGEPRLSVRYLLKRPLEAWVVPPSALVMQTEQQACIVSAEQALPVDVVASALGKSFIVFDDAAIAPARVELHPEQSTRC